jgi:hypothetical protein
MKEREQFVREHLQGEYSVAGPCRRFGISRKTVLVRLGCFYAESTFAKILFRNGWLDPGGDDIGHRPTPRRSKPLGGTRKETSAGADEPPPEARFRLSFVRSS